VAQKHSEVRAANYVSLMPLWSVEFVIEDHERVPLDYAGVRVVGPHNYHVVQPWEEGSGPSSFHLTVKADSSEQAREQAIPLYTQIRGEAGLPPVPPRIATIGYVAGVPFPADRLVFEASDMYAQRRFGLAVVAAQVHCEMWIRARVEEIAKASEHALVQLAPQMPRSWSLMDSSGLRIFEALTGTNPTSAPCWHSYKSHVARRNAFVHRGIEITKEEARESIDAAVAMVDFVSNIEGS
jgi:hypothetical protein